MERKPPGCSYEMNGTVRLVTLSLRRLFELESFGSVFFGKKQIRTIILELKFLGIHTKGVFYSPTNFQLNLIIFEKSRFRDNLR